MILNLDRELLNLDGTSARGSSLGSVLLQLMLAPMPMDTEPPGPTLAEIEQRYRLTLSLAAGGEQDVDHDEISLLLKRVEAADPNHLNVFCKGQLARLLNGRDVGIKPARGLELVEQGA